MTLRRPGASIRSKLALALWGPALLTFVLAGAGLAVFQSLTLERRARQIMAPYAELVAVGTDAAVAFEDPVRAQEILDTLRASPQLRAAELFLADGRLLASFQRTPDASPPLPPAGPDGVRLGHDTAELVQALPREARLRLRMDLGPLREQSRQVLWLFGAGVLVLLAVTLAQFAVLQRTIVAPTALLTDAAELVRARADYRQRVPASGADDVGRLGRSFNAMMEAIQERERDIVRLNRELERRVAERTAQLEAANKELEAFAYSVSHDLRSPLRHVDGFLGMLRARIGPALDEESAHYMALISDAAVRMGALIDALLAFSRMGRNELATARVDLGLLVREAVAELEPEARGRTIDWRISDLPVVAGDRTMLRLVLVNLISNALKFTQPRERAEIQIGCQPGPAAEVVVFVRDNGVGFDLKFAGKLFGVFQRLHAAHEFEGTGVGLANVRRVIGRHGGRTWAEAVVGAGATFYFSLPRREEDGEGNLGGS